MACRPCRGRAGCRTGWRASWSRRTCPTASRWCNRCRCCRRRACRSSSARRTRRSHPGCRATAFGHGETRRNSDELEIAAALAGRHGLDRRGADARARVGLACGRRARRVLHEHFVGDEIVLGAGGLLGASDQSGHEYRKTSSEAERQKSLHFNLSAVRGHCAVRESPQIVGAPSAQRQFTPSCTTLART